MELSLTNLLPLKAYQYQSFSISKFIPNISNSIKSIPLTNYFYYTSIACMAKTSFEIFCKNYSQTIKKNRIVTILQQERDLHKYSLQEMTPTCYSIIYYLFFKILNEVYHKELSSFKAYRRNLFKANKLYYYIKCCQYFYKQMKQNEIEILLEIANCFEVKYDLVKSAFSRGELNYKEIKGKYYSEREGLEIPNDLDIKKMDEIIQCIHKKYLQLYTKIKEMNLNIKDEKIQLISETYAFDYAYYEYDIEYEVIEKCLYQNSLGLVEY